MKYPLGRIHPHGSGGKSVYQRAGQELNDTSSGFGRIICWCIGIPLLGVFFLALIIALASGESFGLSGGALILPAIALALLND